jgi:hypothetical protein
MNLKNCILVFVLAVSLPGFSQKPKYPVLFPYELNARGKVQLPMAITDGYQGYRTDKMELRDLPKTYPYRTVAYFNSGKLVALHVIFGENKELSFEGFELIRKKLLKLLPFEHTHVMHDYRGIDKTSQVWETEEFRVEWIYQYQNNSTTKRVGWLFMYLRNYDRDTYPD